MQSVIFSVVRVLVGRFIILMACVLIGQAVHAQKKWKVTRSEVIDTFPSGQVSSHTTIETKKQMSPPLHEFYERTTVLRTSYYEDGSKRATLKHITKKATWGRPCGDVIYIYTTYYPNGKIKSYEKRRCDKHRSVTKTFNKKGKLLKKVVERNTYNKADKKDENATS